MMVFRLRELQTLNPMYLQGLWVPCIQAWSSYNQALMTTQGIQRMVNAVANLPSSQQAFVEHKMLGVCIHMTSLPRSLCQS